MKRLSWSKSLNPILTRALWSHILVYWDSAIRAAVTEVDSFKVRISELVQIVNHVWGKSSCHTLELATKINYLQKA